MSEEEKVVPTLEEQEEVAEEVAEEVKEEGESIDELKARLAKVEEERENQKRRAEKAEKKAKETPEPTTDGISIKDVLALNEAKISPNDFDEVVRVAKLLGKPVNEALQDKTLKTIIADRVEERTTAEATVTRSARGAKPNTGEDLLKQAEKGSLPSDEKSLEAIAEARLARRKAALSHS